MKKLFILLAMLLIFSPVNKADAFTVVQKDMGYISVNATASKEIIPDTASIYFTVETVSADSKSAVNKNKEITSKLIDSLKPVLALEKSDSIQTKSFILRPNYTYDKNGRKNFVNYTASTVVFVKTKCLEKVSTLIDTAVSNNATSVSDLNFFVENEKRFAGELAQEALSKAQVVAGLTASTLGEKIKGIKSVRVNVYPQNSNPLYGVLRSNAKESAGTLKKQTPLEYGKIKLQANVDAEFYVK